MKVKYWWKESESLRDGIMRPKCDCAEVLDDFKGLVFSFLNDDEGLGLKYLSKWIDDGLIEIEKIKLTTKATYSEKDAIINMLKSGVIIK